jgi:hypothetical protein
LTSPIDHAIVKSLWGISQKQQTEGFSDLASILQAFSRIPAAHFSLVAGQW